MRGIPRPSRIYPSITGSWSIGWMLCLGLFAVAGCDGCPPPPPVAMTSVGLTGGQRIFSDEFERDELGEHWSTESDTWRLEQGAVRGERAYNQPLWLNLALPEQVRVEFDATALSQVGDLKFEIFGDGSHHESGYICIFGGWNNTQTVIARLDEHGADRLDATQHQPVAPHRRYRFAVVRTDHRLRWYVDGELVLQYEDDDPLAGPTRRFFAFNNWEAPVRFDRLEVYDLGE